MRISLKSTLAAFAILVTVAVGQAEAQRPLFIVGGPVIASTTHDNADSKTTFFVGAGTAFPINETFSVAPFVAFIQKGADFGDDFSETLNIIEVPVFLSAGIPLNESISLGLYGGPSVGFIISCEYEEEGFGTYDCDEEDEVKSFEVGINGGAALNFPLTDTVTGAVGVGYSAGLTDLFEDFDEKSRSLYIFGEIGFSLGGM